MAEPFLGSLMLVPYSFAPNGWAFCQGQLLAIRQFTALFSLLGTNYGGDGVATFALPNLQGAIPIASGQGPGLQLYNLGQAGGEPAVALDNNTVPAHQHTIHAANANPSVSDPKGANLSKASIYSSATGTLAQLNPVALAPQGGSAPHNNLMPFLVLNWIIALQGIFPSRP